MSGTRSESVERNPMINKEKKQFNPPTLKRIGRIEDLTRNDEVHSLLKHSGVQVKHGIGPQVGLRSRS